MRASGLDCTSAHPEHAENAVSLGAPAGLEHVARVRDADLRRGGDEALAQPLAALRRKLALDEREANELRVAQRDAIEVREPVTVEPEQPELAERVGDRAQLRGAEPALLEPRLEARELILDGADDARSVALLAQELAVPIVDRERELGLVAADLDRLDPRAVPDSCRLALARADRLDAD